MFSSSIEYWAAQETVRTNAIPALYQQLSLWEAAIFQVYTALTFFAAIMYGAAMPRAYQTQERDTCKNRT